MNEYLRWRLIEKISLFHDMKRDAKEDNEYFLIEVDDVLPLLEEIYDNWVEVDK